MMKVAIIGGVAGGMSCAAKLKRTLGDAVEVTVFEKSDIVSYAACGIPYYVSGHIKEPEELIERTVAQFREKGVMVRTRHKVARVDTSKKLVTGVNVDTGGPFDFAYDKLVVASGARVRRIPPLDEDRENLFEVRDVHDAVAIRRELEKDRVRNVVIVGAGFIGVEMAEACARQGKNVTLVEFAPRILANFDPEMSERIAAELTRNGVTVRTDSKAAALACADGRIVSMDVECGGNRETIPVDMALSCAGIAPNTEFIDVDKAGNGAILVNERMETSAPDVYAAGDCSIMRSFVTGEYQYSPLGTNANKQGKMIAELLAGLRVVPLKLLGSGAVRVFGVDAAKTGLSEGDAQKLGLQYKTNTIVGNSYASYYGKEKLTIKLVYAAKGGRILGAQAVGEGVVAARVNYFAVAISAGMTVEEFGFIDMSYSPPFNGVWDAALIAANTAK